MKQRRIEVSIIANIVDLHTHSNISDGSMSPDELIEHAKQVGLEAVALTDHDRIDGIPQAMATAKRIGLLFIPGIELNSYQDREIHILGYFNEDNYENIRVFLSRAIEERIIRNKKIIEKLNSFGMKITFDEICAEAGKDIFGRPHIAAVMTAKGYVRDISQAFDQYLADGKKAYVVKDFPTAEECVSAIKQAGGLSVLAHPVQINLKLKGIRKIVESLKMFGLEGIEVYYPENKTADTQNYLKLADEYDLLATGGSDFHGVYKKNIHLSTGLGNLVIPDAVLDNILTRLRQLHGNSQSPDHIR